MKKPELLAPAGTLEKLKLAIMYGADAVFLGGQEFGLRSSASNFTIADIEEGVSFANEYGSDVYVTTNIYAHQSNYEGFDKFCIDLERVGVRGIIVSDPGYIKICREYAPKLEIHISTQQSITNLETVKFYEKMGADRTVLARELTFDEIKYITDNCEKEIEVFIHGAVCSSYSGRCTLSNHMTSRDSNRGGCTQSCRWNYDVYSEDGKIDLNNEDAFNMSAQDMQLLNYIPELVNAGIDSFKIEGRMKSNHYVATVVGVYRTAIDAYFEEPENYKVDPKWIEEMQKAESRSTYPGALINDFSKAGQIFNTQYNQNKKFDYCGIVLNYDEKTSIVTLEQRNFFKVGETIEFFGPNAQSFKHVVTKIIHDGENVDRANHPLMKVEFKIDRKVDTSWLVRREN